MIYFLTFGLAFGLSFILTPLMRRIAIKYNIVDLPDSHEAKTHKEPVPYLGGIAIGVSFIVSLMVIRFVTFFPTGTLRALRGIIFGGMIIMLVGFLDDLKPVSFKIKFFIQILLAIILIIFGIRIRFVSPGYLSVLFTILWVVGITNAFNIIDIMDGLSTGIAIIAALFFFFIGLPTEQIYVNFAAVALMGSCLGFLKYNFIPAKIFMGDSGSLFIGFVLAAISLGESYTHINNIALFSPLLILGVPLYDTLLVMILRFQQGKSIFLGSRDHYALRLEALGLDRKKIVLLSYLFCFILGLLAFIITKVTFYLALGIYFIVIIFGFLMGNKLSKIKVKR